MELDLTDRTALVTGSHRGTGLVIARRLGEEGARVIVHGFDADAAQRAAAETGAAGWVHGDITTEAGADAVTAAATGQAGRIDVLINNYGTAGGGDWDTPGEARWLEMYRHNVLSAAHVTQRLLPDMRRRSFGRIVNLGTVGSTRPGERMPEYYGAKGALATLTMSLAKATAGTGIRVNLVSPGLILTPEVEARYVAHGRRQGWGETWAEIEPHVAADIPIRRIVRREEIADLVAFLASPRADAIHGQNIRIDGGALGVLT